MTTVIEEIEYLAWRFAAEPTAEQLDELLRGVRLRASKLVEDTRRPENVVEAASPVRTTSPTERSETLQDSSQDVTEGISNVRVDVGNDVVTLRRCKACSDRAGTEVLQVLTAFSKDSSRKDGLRGNCKKCEAARKKAYRNR